MQREAKLSAEELEAGYRQVTEMNPHIAEPHTMLSQLLYKRGEFAEAVHEAACALKILYDWGTCWDKRHSFAQWVGFSRMAVLRASRRLSSLTSLPQQPVCETSTSTDEKVTNLKEVLTGFHDTTEPQSRSRL